MSQERKTIANRAFRGVCPRMDFIGGDSDTIGAICGAVAGAYYGVPADIREKAEGFLDPFLVETLHKFEQKFLA